VQAPALITRAEQLRRRSSSAIGDRKTDHYRIQDVIIHAGSSHARNKRARIFLALAIAWGATVYAQQNVGQAAILPPPISTMPEQTWKNPRLPCVQPPPPVSWQDYNGPMAKVVGAFGQKLDRVSVPSPSPHLYKPGTVLCSLTLGGKLLLFTEDTFDPITFLGVGFNAGISQAQNTNPSFGQGAAGYGRRFAANFVDHASPAFFKGVVYSEVFSEDPRYYRLGSGAPKRRLFHALEHCVVAHKEENGATTFNFSEWLGTTSAVALGTVYHPGVEPGVGPAAGRITSAIAQDAAYDVLREFWPEIAHKFKLPFRDQQ